MAGPMTPQRASVTAVAGVLAAVGLMLLLVTWAATIGPQQVVRGEGNPPSYEPVSSTPATGAGSPKLNNPHALTGGDNDLLFTIAAIVATLFATVVVLAVVLSIIRWLLTRDWRRSEREPEPEEVVFDPLEAPAQLAARMVEDAAVQRELLTGGSPRNAIVACWHRFEEQASMVGVHRRPWETSSEFTLRVLDRVSADTSAVTTLAELYRDARHSRHEITEANRDAALEAFDIIVRSLTTRAGQ
jgi:hypothetical protein